MLNRQIGILFAVGVLIAVTGTLATFLVPFPAKLEASGGAGGAILRLILVVSMLLAAVSQLYVSHSALRLPAKASLLRTNRAMELLWSLLPGALLLGAVAYAFAPS